jgi:hypothetical protein
MTCGLFLTALPAARGQDEPRGSPTKVGYIDSAVPADVFRFRFDAAYDNNRPDRGEFFYSQYRQQLITGAAGTPLYVNTPVAGNAPTGGGGGGGGNGGGNGGGGSGSNRGRDTVETSAGPAPINVLIGNPNARGLPRPETRVDYQDLSAYGEVLLTGQLSAFVEVPVRFLNPEQNANTTGVGDMNAGFKWAFLCSPDRVLSLQLRTYVPTGDSSRGLGANHVSLEPALLAFQRLSDRVTLEGELRDWVPISGTDFEGNVVRYGLGLSCLAYEAPSLRVSPVVEFVGWTALGGKETAAITPTLFEVRNATGSTVVNLKAGVRLGFGEHCDFYAGYGRALTGEVWYKDIARVEFRRFF